MANRDLVEPQDGLMEQRSGLTTQQILIPVEHEQPQLIRLGVHRRAWRQWVAPVGLILSDAWLALLVWEMAYVLQGIWGYGALSETTEVSLVPFVALWVALRALLGLYPGYGLDAADELRRQVYATIAAVSMLAVLAFATQTADSLSRLLLAVVFLGLLFTAPLARYLVKWTLNKLGVWGKPVVILSYQENGVSLLDNLSRHWAIGYLPFAMLKFCLASVREAPERADDQRLLAHATDLARKHGVNTAIFAMPNTRREQLIKLVSLASFSFQHVMVVPNLGGITNSAVVARNLAGIFAVEIKYNLLDAWALRAKRIIDLIATVLGGILVFPLLFILGILVYLESGSPIFYRDQRMGKDGKLFACVKFRTMVSDAEALLQRILEENPEYREEYSRYHKLREDPRVTRVGRFLRKTSLDELPQLWNVLRGEMSLVGPRPYLPRESRDIGLSQREILRVPPGITGPWQVSGRNRVLFNERVEMDTYYVRDWSVWLDIVLLACTAKVLLVDRSAY